MVKKILLQCRRPEFNPWVGKIPLEEEMATHSSILACRIPMDRGAWPAAVHGVAKSRTWLSNWARTHSAAPLKKCSREENNHGRWSVGSGDRQQSWEEWDGNRSSRCTGSDGGDEIASQTFQVLPTSSSGPLNPTFFCIIILVLQVLEQIWSPQVVLLKPWPSWVHHACNLTNFPKRSSLKQDFLSISHFLCVSGIWELVVWPRGGHEVAVKLSATYSPLWGWRIRF